MIEVSLYGKGRVEMLVQEEAVQTIVASLKKDPYVKAIFLKGSMGRGEHDENSDIDLYCLVNDGDVDAFLQNRLGHLRTYKDLLFYDDIFIIAPQIIAVYDNMIHIDLFTVTEKTFKEKDYFNVLYDPEKRLEKFQNSQNLKLVYEEFRDDVMDVGWFLFQYQKAASRGNGIWAISMLHHVLNHLSRVLLHHYSPNRAQLGLKTLDTSLPFNKKKEMNLIFDSITLKQHGEAVVMIKQLVRHELPWIFSKLITPDKQRLEAFLKKIIL